MFIRSYDYQFARKIELLTSEGLLLDLCHLGRVKGMFVKSMPASARFAVIARSYAYAGVSPISLPVQRFFELTLLGSMRSSQVRVSLHLDDPTNGALEWLRKLIASIKLLDRRLSVKDHVDISIIKLIDQRDEPTSRTF